MKREVRKVHWRSRQRKEKKNLIMRVEVRGREEK